MSEIKSENTSTMNFAGGNKGFSFKLEALPDTYEEFKDFFNQFMKAFEISWTLKAEPFEKIRKYAVDIKEVENLF